MLAHASRAITSTPTKNPAFAENRARLAPVDPALVAAIEAAFAPPAFEPPTDLAPVLSAGLREPKSSASRFVERRPDRFSLSVGGLDLLRPMPSLRELEAFARNLPVVSTVVGPSFWGDGMYDAGNAVYYPLYTKCSELELPLLPSGALLKA